MTYCVFYSSSQPENLVEIMNGKNETKLAIQNRNTISETHLVKRPSRFRNDNRHQFMPKEETLKNESLPRFSVPPRTGITERPDFLKPRGSMQLQLDGTDSKALVAWLDYMRTKQSNQLENLKQNTLAPTYNYAPGRRSKAKKQALKRQALEEQVNTWNTYFNEISTATSPGDCLNKLEK